MKDLSQYPAVVRRIARNQTAKEPRKIGWLARLVRRWRTCPKQAEINRLRRVLHSIANSRPDAHMDIEKNPELVNWICDACHKASVGAYPSNSESIHPESKP